MTIAACYLSTGAVVLGADSTTTVQVYNRTGTASTFRHFNYGQKIFEIGDPGAVALLTWGLASLQTTSYRTLIARLADDLDKNPPASVADVADRWRKLFGDAYRSDFTALMQTAKDLKAKGTARTPAETKHLADLSGLSGGFCIGGSLSDRVPAAVQITFDLINGVGASAALPIGGAMFWGWPNATSRLIYGMDDRIFEEILASGQWKGDRKSLLAIVQPHALGQAANLPLREAVDFLYASIYSTIKAMKFSHFPLICGGPIEIATITADRPFRWVRHKGLAEAILSI